MGPKPQSKSWTGIVISAVREPSAPRVPVPLTASASHVQLPVVAVPSMENRLPGAIS